MFDYDDNLTAVMMDGIFEGIRTVDWIAVGTLVTAGATVVLAVATWVLFLETRRMQKTSNAAIQESIVMRELTERIHQWNMSIHEASREPVFIIRMDIDEVEDFESIIFENVTDNPAYDVSISFSPDPVLTVYKPSSGQENPKLSEVGFHRYPVVAPRQRIVRTFSVFTDGVGIFDGVQHLEDIEVTVSYRTMENVTKNVVLTLDSSHSLKSWYTPRNTLVALQKQIAASTKILSNAILSTSSRDKKS